MVRYSSPGSRGPHSSRPFGPRAGRGDAVPPGTPGGGEPRRRHGGRRSAPGRPAAIRQRRAAEGREPRRVGLAVAGSAGAGSALRPAPDAPQSVLRRRRGAHAGAGHRRQHAGVQPGGGGGAAAAALRRARPPLSAEHHRSRFAPRHEFVLSRLPGLAGAGPHLPGHGGIPERCVQSDRRRGAGTRRQPGLNSRPVRRAGDSAGAGPSLHRRRRRPRGAAELRPLDQAVPWRSDSLGTDGAARRPSVYHSGRPARRLPFSAAPVPRRARGLRAADSEPGPDHVEPASDRAPASRGDGATGARGDERHRAASRRSVPGTPAPGGSRGHAAGAGGGGGLQPDLGHADGRGGLRAADRLRQRGQPSGVAGRGGGRFPSAWPSAPAAGAWCASC